MSYTARSYPGFLRIKQLEVFLLPLDGMLVHRRVTPSIKFARIHLYTWVGRTTLSVICPVQEHNLMTLDKAWNQTA